ncbi:hypothetical protein [Halobellus litoreus]|uniref:ABM domain-containing protein n=1 Tax=Halobellus litoreus TaxID=755310 RepID=A0ABD6DZN3_9EURY|nr:hypothetical protein [Halobellus litoreus]
MKIQHAFTLAGAAVHSIRYFLAGDVRFPHDRLGYVLELQDGDRFSVYRETTLRAARADAVEEPAVLVFRIDVTQREAAAGLREVLFAPVANVATPFFLGLPGFRRKLWLAGEQSGAYLELYEWDSTADAERFVDVMESLLAPFDSLGSTTFEVVEGATVEEYVAARPLAWRATASIGRQSGEDGQRSVRFALLALALVAAGYAVWRFCSRRGRVARSGKEA